MTDKDEEIEAAKLDENNRRQRLENANYQLYREDMLNAQQDDSALGTY